MSEVHKELGRLGRAYATSVGARRAARLHIALLAVAALAAFVSRAVVPLPGVRALEHDWIRAPLVGIALLLFGWVLRTLMTQTVRPRPRTTARRLDDANAWRDDTNTAAGLSDDAATATVPALLVAQTLGRLRELNAESLWPKHLPRKFVRYVLVFLFVFCLLAPGVDGLLGERGAGTGTTAGLGQTPDRAFGAADPFAADRFLMIFAEDPLAATPLPPEPKPDDGADPVQPGDEPKEDDK